MKYPTVSLLILSTAVPIIGPSDGVVPAVIVPALKTAATAAGSTAVSQCVRRIMEFHEDAEKMEVDNIKRHSALSRLMSTLQFDLSDGEVQSAVNNVMVKLSAFSSRFHEAVGETLRLVGTLRINYIFLSNTVSNNKTEELIGRHQIYSTMVEHVVKKTERSVALLNSTSVDVTRTFAVDVSAMFSVLKIQAARKTRDMEELKSQNQRILDDYKWWWYDGPSSSEHKTAKDLVNALQGRSKSFEEFSSMVQSYEEWLKIECATLQTKIKVVSKDVNLLNGAGAGALDGMQFSDPRTVRTEESAKTSSNNLLRVGKLLLEAAESFDSMQSSGSSTPNSAINRRKRSALHNSEKCEEIKAALKENSNFSIFNIRESSVASHANNTPLISFLVNNNTQSPTKTVIDITMIALDYFNTEVYCYVTAKHSIFMDTCRECLGSLAKSWGAETKINYTRRSEVLRSTTMFIDSMTSTNNELSSIESRIQGGAVEFKAYVEVINVFHVSEDVTDAAQFEDFHKKVHKRLMAYVSNAQLLTDRMIFQLLPVIASTKRKGKQLIDELKLTLIGFSF